jgi:hypothetical protein
MTLLFWPGLKNKIRNDLKSRIRILTNSFRIHNTAFCTMWTGYVAHHHDLTMLGQVRIG